MRLRNILFPEGGRLRNFLREYNKKIKIMVYGKVPEVSKDVTYKKIAERLKPKRKELKDERSTKFKIQPKISIVLSKESISDKKTKDSIKSIKKQTYSNWEICTTKIKEATGDYITFIRQGDLIPEHCLYEFVKYINEHPDIDFIYSDEDKFIKNKYNRFAPIFKPDFTIDMLRSNNYIGNMAILKKELVELDTDNEGNYDLMLRVAEKTNKIGHISKVLYHSRQEMENTNPTEKKNDKKVILEHLQREGLKAEVKDTQVEGIYEVEYEVVGTPKVTILIPNKDEKETLQTCVESILNKTTYKNFKIAIIENNSTSQEIKDYYKELEKNEKVKILYYPEKEFNYSKIINYGAKNTDGEYIIQLNNDTEIITTDWIEKMLGFCQRKDVGAVGGRLYYPDMSLQHGGVVLGIGGLAGHRFLYLPKDQHAYCNEEIKITNLTAVTAACMMAKRSVYEEVGYMNEDLAVAFNDVDFCLKIREKGLLIVYNPFVELLHYESKTRGKEDSPEKQQRFSDEIDTFMDKWREKVIEGDPYYNKNLLIPEIGENIIQSTI